VCVRASRHLQLAHLDRPVGLSHLYSVTISMGLSYSHAPMGLSVSLTHQCTVHLFWTDPLVTRYNHDGCEISKFCKLSKGFGTLPFFRQEACRSLAKRSILKKHANSFEAHNILTIADKHQHMAQTWHAVYFDMRTTLTWSTLTCGLLWHSVDTFVQTLCIWYTLEPFVQVPPSIWSEVWAGKGCAGGPG